MISLDLRMLAEGCYNYVTARPALGKGKRAMPNLLTSAALFHIFGNMKSTEVVLALEALAQESRLAIFRLPIEAGLEGRPAGRIAAKVGLPAPNFVVSFVTAEARPG